MKKIPRFLSTPVLLLAFYTIIFLMIYYLVVIAKLVYDMVVAGITAVQQ